MQNSGRPEGTEMQEARPVDENGKAVLADGEELREPAEQLTGERPELPEGIQNGERPEFPEGIRNGERPELPEGIQNNERPEGTEMQEARPVDENGKAILADGEELREPAEQLTGERPELPEGAESEMTEKRPRHRSDEADAQLPAEDAGRDRERSC